MERGRELFDASEGVPGGASPFRRTVQHFRFPARVNRQRVCFRTSGRKTLWARDRPVTEVATLWQRLAIPGNTRVVRAGFAMATAVVRELRVGTQAGRGAGSASEQGASGTKITDTYIAVLLNMRWMSSRLDKIKNKLENVWVAEESGATHFCVNGFGKLSTQTPAIWRRGAVIESGNCWQRVPITQPAIITEVGRGNTGERAGMRAREDL